MQKGEVIWFTGLSGSGKTTLGRLLQKVLNERGIAAVLLDGDEIRRGLSADLRFSMSDRTNNIKRIAAVAKLLSDQGYVVICAAITPLEEHREYVREQFWPEIFVEIFLDCPLEGCEMRDTKGLYRKARDGQIDHFTGISSPFEEPEHFDLWLSTESNSIERSLRVLLEYLEKRFPDFRYIGL